MSKFDYLHSSNLCLMGLGCPLLRGSPDRSLRRCAATTVKSLPETLQSHLNEIKKTFYIERFFTPGVNNIFPNPSDNKAFPQRVLKLRKGIRRGSLKSWYLLPNIVCFDLFFVCRNSKLNQNDINGQCKTIQEKHKV